MKMKVEMKADCNHGLILRRIWEPLPKKRIFGTVRQMMNPPSKNHKN